MQPTALLPVRPLYSQSVWQMPAPCFLCRVSLSRVRRAYYEVRFLSTIGLPALPCPAFSLVFRGVPGFSQSTSGQTAKEKSGMLMESSRSMSDLACMHPTRSMPS
jgi:hypothetical protein